MMSRQSSRNISALHRQKVKGREIIVTEETRLHVVWIYDRIFIKPLPKYFLSYEFWENYLLNSGSPLGHKREQIMQSALGYVRTYNFLVRHESDFAIAQDDRLQLIPPGVSWGQFCAFMARFDVIDDSDVAARYAFGELRLTRLNFYSKFFLRKFHYHRIHPQYSTYFGRFYGPLVFVFGILTVVLSTLQVEIAIEALSNDAFSNIRKSSRRFCISVIVFVSSLSLALLMLFTYKFVAEWRTAILDRQKRIRMQRRVSPENP